MNVFQTLGIKSAKIIFRKIENTVSIHICKGIERQSFIQNYVVFTGSRQFLITIYTYVWHADGRNADCIPKKRIINNPKKVNDKKFNVSTWAIQMLSSTN